MQKFGCEFGDKLRVAKGQQGLCPARCLLRMPAYPLQEVSDLQRAENDRTYQVRHQHIPRKLLVILPAEESRPLAVLRQRKAWPTARRILIEEQQDLHPGLPQSGS
jgi:hypothetical protein